MTEQLEFAFWKPRDHRPPKHYWQHNEVVDIFVSRLGLSAECLGLYSFLTRRANNTTGEIRNFGVRKIARDLHVSKSTAARWIKTLQDFGLIALSVSKDRSQPTVITILDVRELLKERKDGESRVPPVGQSEGWDVSHGRDRLAVGCPVDGTGCPTGGTVIMDVKTKDGNTQVSSERLLGFEGDFPQGDVPVSSSRAIAIIGTSTEGNSPQGDTDNLQSRDRDLEHSGSPTLNQSADGEVSEQDIQRVLSAFASSPVTKGTISQQDRAQAIDLLEKFSQENIKKGILLGTCNRINSLLNREPGQPKQTPIQSLNYFVNSILEAMDDKIYTPMYMQYVESIIKRYAPLIQKTL